MPLAPLQVRVPGSTSNVGPGFDAFGIAVNLFLEVRWVPAETTSIERRGPLQESTLAVGQDPLVRGMRRAAMLAGRSLPAGRLTVSAPFPPGRGLGASGAGLVAGLVLGARLCGREIARDVLLREAIELEGNPENAVAALLGGAHWSLRLADGSFEHLPVELHRDLRFLFVLPPYPLDTRRAREILPPTVPFAAATAQAQRAGALAAALRTLQPELLRAALEDTLVVEPRLKLLTGVGKVIEFAYEAGALGATLSGAGSGVLVLARRGDVDALELRLKRRVERLWGESGLVLRAAPEVEGARLKR
jgi:homoserine kinase